VAARLRRGALRQASAVMTGGLVPAGRGRTPAAMLAWAFAPHIIKSDDDAADMAATVEAEDEFDLAACARPIQAPTLIFVGGRDAFYSRAEFEETARLIPDARLELVEGRGHVTVLMGKGFGSAVRDFLVTPA
jgi:pimeloyl-ACP methyl ester carboxylesterase